MPTRDTGGNNEAAFDRFDDLYAGWRADLLSGKSPTLYPAGTGPLARVEIGPGLVSLFGGPPGVGKTAFTMQLVVDALRLTPTVKALVANVEMRPAALFDRQLARVSGIDLRTVRHRKLTPAHQDRVRIALDTLAGPAGRLAFCRPPFRVDGVAAAAKAFGAHLVLLDYVQRFAPPGEYVSRKTAVDDVMEVIRRIADAGAAVVVVAAVGRQRNERGQSSYDGLTLASFRESSELEYGADDAYLLVRDDMEDPAAVTLKNVKSRHGETRNLPLRFTGSLQRFEPADDWSDGTATADAVRNAWGPFDGAGGRNE